MEFGDYEDGGFIARVKDKYDTRSAIIFFTRDGRGISKHWCNCGVGSRGDCLCKHIVAAILAIQGGFYESRLCLGKSASVSVAVGDSNTAKAAGSGSLGVFAAPALIALMEQAACAALSDALEDGQKSVGTAIKK